MGLARDRWLGALCYLASKKRFNNMKNIYKFFLLTLVIFVVSPSVVLASWWNPISWFNGWSFSKNADSKIETLEKRIQELEKNTASSTRNVIATSSIKTNAVSQAINKTSAPKSTSTIVKSDKNFHDSLLPLYTDKISFLDNQIASDTFGLYLVKAKIDEVNKFISDSEALQAKYSWSNTATLNNIAVEHTNFNKYQIAQMKIALSSLQERIAALGLIKSRLGKEFATMSSNVFEGEFKLRTAELDSLVDKDKIKAQQTKIMDSIGALTKIDEDYNDLELKAAYQQKSQAESDLAALKAQEATISIPVVQSASIIAPAQQQPSSIHCDTTYNANSGNPSTLCTEFPTMKSIRCNTTYSVYGNPQKDCYFQ